jgi:hypothetical protein
MFPDSQGADEEIFLLDVGGDLTHSRLRQLDAIHSDMTGGFEQFEIALCQHVHQRCFARSTVTPLSFDLVRLYLLPMIANIR